MKRHILIAILILVALTAAAQHDEQVTVEGKYRPKVNKVNKLVLQPETPQLHHGGRRNTAFAAIPL